MTISPWFWRLQTRVALVALTLLSATGCAKDRSYYPLEVGHFWEYQSYFYNSLDISLQEVSEIMAEMRGSKHPTFRPQGTSLEFRMTAMPLRELGGRRGTPLKVESGTTTWFVFSGHDSTGYYRNGRQRPGNLEPEVWSSATYFLLTEVKLGNSWTTAYTPSLIEPETTLQVTYEVAAVNDVVTVPAGTFTECVKITGRGQAGSDFGHRGRPSFEVDSTVWYAPGIGEVQGILLERDNLLAQGGRVVVQLKAYGSSG